MADRKVLIVEDGPTVTHGEMRFGAGTVIAKKFGAREIIDPRAFAVGSLAETFRTYQAIGPLLPAMGYSDQQVGDLEATIDRVPCDVVGTPIDLSRLMTIRKPVVRVRYELQEIGQPDLGLVITDFLGRLSVPAPACTRHGKVMTRVDGDPDG